MLIFLILKYKNQALGLFPMLLGKFIKFSGDQVMIFLIFLFLQPLIMGRLI